MNFSITVVTSFAETPEGYSVQALDEMVKDTGIDLSDKGSADPDSSNIIVIMNESYTDVRPPNPESKNPIGLLSIYTSVIICTY